MVKLNIKNTEIFEPVFEENEPNEAQLELAKLEKKTRERESKTKKLEEKIRELELENSNLVAACDRLNAEIERLDREKTALQQQQNGQFDQVEINDLISAITTWISANRKTVQRDRRINRRRGFQSEIERRDIRMRALLEKLQNL